MKKLLDHPAAVAIVYLLLMITAIVWVHGGIVFTVSPWLDEHHTLLLTQKGSMLRSIRELAAGSDYNPPLLYLLERSLGAVMGGVTVLSLRTLSFLCVWLALVTVFLTLRRTFSSSAAFLGAFALWTSSVVVEFTFEGRGYGQWMLFCAMTLWSVTWKPERDEFRARDFVLAVSSVLVCTIHYFGIFSLALIAAGSAVWISRTTRNYRRLAPMIAGPIALAACTPVYLGQRHALIAPSWMSPLSLHQIRDLFAAYFVTPTILTVLGVFVLLLARRVFKRVDGPRLRYEASLPFLALMCMPVMLIAVSAFMQPAMQAKYVIPVILVWAPIVAFVADRLSRFGKAALFCLLFVFSLRPLSVYARQRENQDLEISTEKMAVAPFLDSGFVLIDPNRTSLYPLAEATGRSSQLSFPDFSDSVARARHFSNRMIHERDVGRVHSRLYGFPLLQSIDEVQKKDLYVFLPSFDTEYTLSLLFPDAQITRLAWHVYRVRATGDSIARAPNSVDRAVALYNTRHPQAALSLLDSALASDPNHYGALWYRAAALEELGMKGDAMRAWRLVISEADQSGWRAGLEQAKARQSRLLCADLSRDDLVRAALPLSQRFRRRFMC